MRASGARTRSVQRLATSSGMATSLAPRNAASSGVGAQAQVPVGVLQADDRAIDHRPDRQRKPGQRHDVDRIARGVKPDQRRQDRDRDRQHGDDRHPPLAQEQQDHQRAEDRPQHAFFHQALDRMADIDRLVQDHFQVDARAGQSRLDLVDRSLKSVRPRGACWSRAGGRPVRRPVACR